MGKKIIWINRRERPMTLGDKEPIMDIGEVEIREEQFEGENKND